MAELSSGEKNKISHRAEALKSCPLYWIKRKGGGPIMKVLIVSDSHGLEDELEMIAERHGKETDLIIHCGDSELDPSHPALSSYLTVKGNCDFTGSSKTKSSFPPDRESFFTHGHLYGIKQSLLNVYCRAEELGADIICFGHSHIAGSELMDGKLLINPGSIRLPRVRKEKLMLY